MLKNFRFEKIFDGSHLSQAVTNSILQDSQDFIWFGTDDGLIRYDGNNLKIFKTDRYNKNSLQDDFITSICILSSGKLLIGTDTSFLFEYNSKLENFNEIPLPNRDPKHHITSIIEDKYNNIWLGTSGNGLYRLDKELNFSYQFKITDFENSLTINDNNVRCIYFDNLASKLFIGTNKGLNIYYYVYNCFTYLVSDSKNLDSLSNNKINFIYRDSRNILWIGTGGGLNKFDKEKNKFLVYYHDSPLKNSLSGNNILSICEDNQGYLWIGTESGLNCFEIETSKFLRFCYDKNDIYGIIGNTIECLFKDKTNVIWIGTDGSGIGKIDRHQKNFYHIPNKSVEPDKDKFNSVWSIFKDYENNLWIGFETGLYKCIIDSDDNFIFSKFNKLQSTKILGISDDSQNNLWINCSPHGIFSVNISENKIISNNSEIFMEYIDPPFAFCQCVDRDNPNHIWLGLPNVGLLKLDKTTGKFIDSDKIPNTLKNITVFTLYMGSENILWVGSRGNGLFKYDINQNSATNFIYDPNDNDSISDDTINCAIEDKNNNVWIGTMKAGLNMYDKKGNKFKRFSENEEIYGILVDERNNLWMSTNNGLLKFDSVNETICTYYKSDGLQGNVFNGCAYHKSKDDIMYFGGAYGITYFRPEEIFNNPFIPNVVITDFQIYNESIKPSLENPFLEKNITEAKEIILTYRENVFSFEFAALIFNNPQKNQYAYMMTGFDKDWVYCGTRRNVTYTNLDPGEYTFRVKGSNNDGVWNEEGVSVKLIITPPWWLTWWFKSCGAALIFLTAGFGYKKRVSKLKKEKTAQEEFSRRLIESQEEERKRIASALHDTIAHDILLTKSKALLALRNPDDNENLKNALNEISNMSSETINDVRGISYNLHPHQLERLGFSEAIESIIKDVSRASDIEFSVKVDNVDDVISKEAEINLYRVIQEGINNIIKHSKATEAELKVIRLENQIIITISDNGIGLASDKNSSEDRKHGFGLSGIAERVKILKGEFKVESEENSGTVLRISIPIVKPF